MTLLPPPQYDHPPEIPVIERVLPWSEVQIKCFNLAAKYNGVAEAQRKRQWGWGGCSGLFSDGKCYIWRTDNPDIARHELGHCNGWKHD